MRHPFSLRVIVGAFMPGRRSRRLASAVGVVLGMLVAGSVHAAVVTLSFSGTLENGGLEPVFGQSGAVVPYQFQITYDTALDTNTAFYATGATLGHETTTHEWHGYSASGITATRLSFGTQTWTAGDVMPMVPAAGVDADLWFDTDISVATPTRSWIAFSVGSPDVGLLHLGIGVSDGVHIVMDRLTGVMDTGTGASMASFDMSISAVPVPEPATLALVACGLLALAGRRLARGAFVRLAILCAVAGGVAPAVAMPITGTVLLSGNVAATGPAHAQDYAGADSVTITYTIQGKLDANGKMVFDPVGSKVTVTDSNYHWTTLEIPITLVTGDLSTDTVSTFQFSATDWYADASSDGIANNGITGNIDLVNQLGRITASYTDVNTHEVYRYAFTSVAEPPAWAVVALGLGGLGLAGRRRGRPAVARSAGRRVAE